MLQVTANHLGGGLVQYTLNVNNDLGGNSAVQISASGNINQIATIFFPDAFPNGGASLQSNADLAQGFGRKYPSFIAKLVIRLVEVCP